MMVDKRNEFADDVDLATAGTGVQNVGDVIDAAPARDVGAGHVPYLVIQVSKAFTSGGSATVEFRLVSDSVSTPAIDGNETIHYKSDAFPVASLVQGWQIAVPFPYGDSEAPNNTGYERYIGVAANVGTAALTAGAINAFVTYDPPTHWKSYPDAQN